MKTPIIDPDTNTIIDTVTTIISAGFGTALLGLLAVITAIAIFVVACFVVSVASVAIIAGVAGAAEEPDAAARVVVQECSKK